MPSTRHSSVFSHQLAVQDGQILLRSSWASKGLTGQANSISIFSHFFLFFLLPLLQPFDPLLIIAWGGLAMIAEHRRFFTKYHIRSGAPCPAVPGTCQPVLQLCPVISIFLATSSINWEYALVPSRYAVLGADGISPDRLPLHASSTHEVALVPFHVQVRDQVHH